MSKPRLRDLLASKALTPRQKAQIIAAAIRKALR